MIRPVRPDGTIETGGAFVPVFRSRIVGRMASAARQRIALLIAPAGYGKSVALSQYLRDLRTPWLRYDVLADNTGLLGFLRGLADAVIDVAPDARTTLPGAYEKNVESDTPGAHLALWMATHVREYRGTIVIDDLHVAQEDREVTRFLTSLIERTKGTLSWILSSRSSVGLPIGTWLAYGDSDLAIDDHDLKFSLAEAREAARSFKLAVGDAELSELLNLTDGWATALSFALRSSTRSVDLRSVSSMTRDMMYRYLAEQVYQSFSKTELAFIETAALLPQVDAPTMVAAGFDRATAIIDGLRGRAAFINADPDNKVFRLHDLFKDYVLHELSLRGADATSERINNVAAMLERLGQYSMALALYSRDGNREQVVRMICERGIELIDHGYVEDVRKAAEFLDEKTVDGEVRGIAGLLHLAAGRYDLGERILATAIPNIRNAYLQGELLLRYSVHLLNRGRDVSDLVTALAESTEEAPEGHRLEAQSILASSEARAGRSAKARTLIDALEPVLESIGNVALAARLNLRTGAAAMWIGDERSRKFLDRVVELAEQQGLWAMSSRAHRLLCGITRGVESDSATSLWHSQQASTAATRAGDYYDVQMSYLMMLSMETQRGNAEGAETVERALAELGKTDTASSPYILEAQAHRFVWQERFAEAGRIFQTIRGRQPHPEDRALISAAYCLCLALENSADDCAIASAEALHEIAIADRDHVTVQIAVSFVIAADILSKRFTVVRRAIQRLRRSKHEVTKLLVHAMEELLAMAESATFASSDLLHHLQAVAGHGFGGYGRYLELVAKEITGRRVPEDSVRLTPSETRVLRALAEGRTPKQIAAEIGRSTLTVQTHIQNVAKKLGGHSRADAIAVARQLGLL